MRRVALLFALVALSEAGAHVSSGTASTESGKSVTLAVQRSYNASSRLYGFRFSGAISRRAAGEYVVVLLQKCGQSFSTAVAGTSTDARGFWQTGPSAPLWAGSGTYQARWKNDLSKPVLLRPAIDVQATKRAGGKIRVTVTTYEVPQNLNGRVVVLQRLEGGKWSDVRRAKLGDDPNRGYLPSYAATFTVPRGWTVRARVPAKTAAPCFKPSATEKLRS